MHSYAKTLVVASFLTFGPFVMSFAVPEWTRRAGLDCWNYGAEKHLLEESNLEAQRLDAVEERLLVKIAVAERLAQDVCEGSITLEAALDELTVIAKDDPDWCQVLRIRFHSSHAWTDRDLLVIYLRGKLLRLHDAALDSGDVSRATHIQGRMVQFDEDGDSCYYGTYTAYNGKEIRTMLMKTVDFNEFSISTMTGPAIQDKGMALFPGKINGKYSYSRLESSTGQ